MTHTDTSKLTPEQAGSLADTLSKMFNVACKNGNGNGDSDWVCAEFSALHARSLDAV